MLNVNRKHSLSIFLISIFLCYTSVLASPTKEETADFIISKSNMLRSASFCEGKNESEFHVEFENNYCTLKYIFNVKNIAFGETEERGKVDCNSDRISHRRTETVDLKEIDPDRIETDNSSVILYVREDKKLINQVTEYFEGNWKSKDPGYYSQYDNEYIYINVFGNPINKEKLHKALKHQVMLCGGKGELF